MPHIVPAATLGLLLAGFAPWTPAQPATVHHELRVTLDPDMHALRVVDRVKLPPFMTATPEGITFILHAGLNPRVNPPATLIRIGRENGRPVPWETYRLTLPPDTDNATLRYQGELHHPLGTATEGRGRTQRHTPGLIDSRGVYLDGNSLWYPRFGEEMVSFSLTVEPPAGWHAVSQGEGPRPGDGTTVSWSETQPQDHIYLLAGPFNVYRQATPVADAQAYLRQPDPQLAERYLDATARYLSLYSKLLGPYPYGKFALVENFWETGYGMPSFTLLGSRVIRLPFIVFTSYPHEILHNWWGNSVYVDYASGNWAEGLTSYLADHLLQERRGRGAEYRRAALQKYADYVAVGKEFPLKAFRARHGEISQAVGYNKTLMFFHMLRRRLGDELFLAALRQFYQENRFRVAGYADLRRAFEDVSGIDLSAEFHQWVERTGAPSLRVSDVIVVKTDSTFRLRGILEQTQAQPVYSMGVPLAIQLEGHDTAFEQTIEMKKKRVAVELDLPAKALRLAVDPRFDLFRRLDRQEIPPSLGQLFGTEDLLFVLPSDAPDDLRQAYRALASSWARDDENLVWDSELQALPVDRTVWLMGWENRLRPRIEAALAPQGVTVNEHRVTMPASKHLSADGDSVVLAVRHPVDRKLTVGWLGSENPAALPGLARKLPHYGKYSYLAFTGSAPTNVLKGQWQVQDSPLNMRLVDTDLSPLRLAPRRPLTDAIDPVSQNQPSRNAHSM